VKILFQFRCNPFSLHQIRQAGKSFDESLAAADAGAGPGSRFFKIADEHFIQAHGIRTVLGDDFIGVDHIASGLGHFFAVFTENHAVRGSFCIGFGAF